MASHPLEKQSTNVSALKQNYSYEFAILGGLPIYWRLQLVLSRTRKEISRLRLRRGGFCVMRQGIFRRTSEMKGLVEFRLFDADATF